MSENINSVEISLTMIANMLMEINDSLRETKFAIEHMNAKME